MSIQLKAKPEIFHGKVIDWNWIEDYGLLRLDNGKEYFLHHSNVKIKARDLSGKLIKLKLNDKGYPVTNNEGNSFVRADDADPQIEPNKSMGVPPPEDFMMPKAMKLR